MKLSGDNLEYAISQYVDGTLGELERRALEEQLATDGEARALVEQYTQLNTVLRSADPVPAVDFQLFGARISAAIEHEALPAPKSLSLPRAVLRYVAVAAALALAATVGIHFMAGTAQAPQVAVSTGSIQVQGPAEEAAKSKPSIHLAVGPSEALARRGDRLSLGDDAIFTHRPRVVISAADAPRRSDVPLY